MPRLPKSVLAVGSVALAAGLFILAAPRTVHAVAAALVQITNTASNPVVTQTTGAQAANMVHLNCTFNLDSQNEACVQITSAGLLVDEGPNVPYIVPSGNYLVITAADVFPASNGGNDARCPGIYTAVIGSDSNPGNPTSFLSLTTSNNPVTTHFTYPPPSGIVIGPGTGVFSWGYIINPATGQYVGSCANFALDVVDIYGYLTTD